jgi:hypothetical protein
MRKILILSCLFASSSIAASKPQPENYGIVRINDSRKLVIVDQLGGAETTFKIGSGADADPAVPVTKNGKRRKLRDLKPGDHVRVDVDPSTAKVVDILVLNIANTATTGGTQRPFGPGVITKWEPNRNLLTVKIKNGSKTFHTNGSTKVVEGGVGVSLSSLRPGETVTVTADPGSFKASKIVLP